MSLFNINCIWHNLSDLWGLINGYFRLCVSIASLETFHEARLKLDGRQQRARLFATFHEIEEHVKRSLHLVLHVQNYALRFLDLLLQNDSL